MVALHITNGDSAVERIQAAGIAGDVLPWRDVLHEGPVPGRLGFAQLREMRARFIGECGWGQADEVLHEQEKRDALLDGSGERDELVLWFEHDLYDQLQLIQILHRLVVQGPDPRRLSLACEAEYLGMMSVDRVRALYARRTAVTHEQVRLAAAAWSAFTAPDAGARLAALLEGDLSPLPFLGAALRRHLEEFPSTRTGLSRSEQQALEVIAEGARTPGEAYPRAHHQREDPIFLGDTVFAWYLERMSRVPAPLVLFDDGTTVRWPRDDEQQAFWKRAVRLTDAGRSVLDGEENAVALNGIDRWLGGVHLQAAAGRPWVPPG